MGLWTKTHAITLIPSVAVMLLLGFILHIVLGNKPEKLRMLPIQIIAILLVLLEIGKQGLSLYQGYDLYFLPFHFCSLFIFALPLMAFYKGKHRDAVRRVTTVLCASVFMIMLIYPSLIYSDTDVLQFFSVYISFHTVLFHNLVMLAFVLILALNLCPTPKTGSYRTVMLTIVVFCIVSASMAYLLKTNYANFYTCNIPVFETIRVALTPILGAFFTQLIYVVLVALVNLAFVSLAYGLCRILQMKISHSKHAVLHR